MVKGLHSGPYVLFAVVEADILSGPVLERGGAFSSLFSGRFSEFEP
jgi:hypothetical protein